MERKRLAEDAAREIANRIRDGVWVGRMPGIRPIAAALGVSPTTVTEAIAILEDAGVVAPTAVGKRRKILQSKPASDVSARGLACKRIGLLLFQKSWDEFEPEEHRMFGMIKKRFEERGAIFDYVFNPRVFDLARPAAALRSLVVEQPMDLWIPVTPSTAMARWFAERDQPFLFLGGDQYELGTTFAHRLSQKVKPCIAALKELGHQRIVMPIPEMWHRNESEETGFERNFQTWLQEIGIRSSSFNTPRFGATSESLLKTLEKTFSLTPPTALLLPSVRDYLCTAGFLQERKQLVPQDISISLLTWEPGIDWIHPKPAHFREANEPLVKQLVQHAAEVFRNGNPKGPEAVHGGGEFVLGDSIGPARKR